MLQREVHRINIKVVQKLIDSGCQVTKASFIAYVGALGLFGSSSDHGDYPSGADILELAQVLVAHLSVAERSTLACEMMGYWEGAHWRASAETLLDYARRNA